MAAPTTFDPARTEIIKGANGQQRLVWTACPNCKRHRTADETVRSFSQHAAWCGKNRRQGITARRRKDTTPADWHAETQGRIIALTVEVARLAAALVDIDKRLARWEA